MRALTNDTLTAIGLQVSVAYLPTVREPLPIELKDVVARLVAFESAPARIEREIRGGSATCLDTGGRASWIGWPINWLAGFSPLSNIRGPLT